MSLAQQWFRARVKVFRVLILWPLVHGPRVTELITRRRQVRASSRIMRPGNDENPNIHDLPPSETGGGTSRNPVHEVQQVMSAQPARARSSVLLNGSYGSLGVMDLDSELQAAPTREVHEEMVGAGSSTGTQEESSVGALRAAAGCCRVLVEPPLYPRFLTRRVLTLDRQRLFKLRYESRCKHLWRCKANFSVG